MTCVAVGANVWGERRGTLPSLREWMMGSWWATWMSWILRLPRSLECGRTCCEGAGADACPRRCVLYVCPGALCLFSFWFPLQAALVAPRTTSHGSSAARATCPSAHPAARCLPCSGGRPPPHPRRRPGCAPTPHTRARAWADRIDTCCVVWEGGCETEARVCRPLTRGRATAKGELPCSWRRRGARARVVADYWPPRPLAAAVPLAVYAWPAAKRVARHGLLVGGVDKASG